MGSICLTSEEPSIDANYAMLIDTSDDQNQDISPTTVTFDIKVGVARNTSHPEYDDLIDRNFGREVHAVERSLRDRPW